MDPDSRSAHCVGWQQQIRIRAGRKCQWPTSLREGKISAKQKYVLLYLSAKCKIVYNFCCKVSTSGTNLGAFSTACVLVSRYTDKEDPLSQIDPVLLEYDDDRYILNNT